MLNIADPIAAFDFDCALAYRCEHAEGEALEDAMREDKGGAIAALFVLLATKL